MPSIKSKRRRRGAQLNKARYEMLDLRTLPRRIAHYAIRAYQLSLSAFIGRQCRHEPSCSAYMDEAIARHGVVAGGQLGLARLCRCRPWGTAGYDPVPERLSARGLGVFLDGLKRGTRPDSRPASATPKERP